MKRINVFAVLITTLFVLSGLSFTYCKMKYKEHYRITSLQLELLKVNGQNKYGQSLLDPLDSFSNGDTVMLYLRFEHEFFSTGIKTASFPQQGSLGPADTIKSLKFFLQTPGGETMDIEDSLYNLITGERVELSAPKPLPGHYACLRNPVVSFSSVTDFISKFNSRQPQVLFEKLKDYGLILGLNPSILAGDTIERKVDFIVTLQLTNGKTLSDTTSAMFARK